MGPRIESRPFANSLEQVRGRLLMGLHVGQYQPGDRAPSIRRMAASRCCDLAVVICLDSYCRPTPERKSTTESYLANSAAVRPSSSTASTSTPSATASLTASRLRASRLAGSADTNALILREPAKLSSTGAEIQYVLVCQIEPWLQPPSEADNRSIERPLNCGTSVGRGGPKIVFDYCLMGGIIFHIFILYPVTARQRTRSNLSV